MIWWFLLAAAMFVLGGLLAVQPSKTEKRIAKLRESAMQKGLYVKLPTSLKFPQAAVKSEHPYYCINLKDRSLANRYAHLIRAQDGKLPDSTHMDSLQTKLRDIFVDLPSQYTAIYLGAGLAGISWNEAECLSVPEELVKALSELEMKLSA